jgi:hypothetical protein
LEVIAWSQVITSGSCLRAGKLFSRDPLPA